MKKLVFFLAIIVLAACSTDRTAEIKKEIKEKKGKVLALNDEIKKLEKELQLTADKDTIILKIPVKVEEVNPGNFEHYFNANGVVEAVNEAFVSPEINGQIEEVLVKEGQRVNKDQLLARLNTDVTDNAIKELETALELATVVYKKQKQLWEKKIGSEIQYLQAENNKESLESKLETLKSQKEMAFVKSPIDGIVDEIYLKKGEMVAPGQAFIQVINLDELYVNIDVSEAYLPAIHNNDMVNLSFPAYPGFNEKVPIYRIGNIIEPDNRTFLVQLKIKNQNDKFKPNMVAIIQINDFTTDSAIIIPSLIIKEDLVGPYVYVAKKKDGRLIAEKHYVTPGRSYNENTMLLEGLKAGDEVIVAGFDQVSGGDAISIVE